MIREVEFELRTQSEANSRFGTKAGMFAKAARIAEQRSEVRRILNDTFGAPPLSAVIDDKMWTVANPIEVTLTRLAPGELDADENLPMAFKAVKDEIAAWLGINDRDKRVRWSYAQQRTSAGIYKVRILIVDAAPGEPKRVVMATKAEHDSGTSAPLVKWTKKRRAAAEQPELAITPSFAALPWEQAECAADVHRAGLGHIDCTLCNGTGRGKGRRLVPLRRFDGLGDDLPHDIEWPVPPEHAARYTTARVRLHRRAWASKKFGQCWLFETRDLTSPAGAGAAATTKP